MNHKCVRGFLAASVTVSAMTLGGTALAQTPVEEWTKVDTPPPPTVKPVTVDPSTTALLMLDFMGSNCGKRPRCIASLPAMKNLLSQARTRNMLVVYGLISKTTTADVLKDVAPQPSDPSVLSGPDKFVNTNLEQILKDKGIKTVIAVGTAAHGAVLYTASGAAFRGYSVIVPIDGMSANDVYTELVTATVLSTAPTVGMRTTLTKSDMIKF